MINIQKLISKSLSINNELRLAFVAFASILSFGTLAYHYLERWSWVDSLYFSVITLTTIGYGDLHPTQDITKLFTVCYVLIGVGLVFYLFTTFAKHMFEDEKKEIHRLDRTIAHLEELLASKIASEAKK